MEENINISKLNDFIFCPRSIYFHNIYSSYEDELYYSTYQIKGRNVHQKIDSAKYSTKSDILEGIFVYNEEFGLIGKIDLFDVKNKLLIERKKKIKIIYEGYYLQLYAQYYCLIEMGYVVDKIKIYSAEDNKNYDILLPTKSEKKRLLYVIDQIKSFDLENKNFSQNPKKCFMCIYKELCDYYQNDE